MKHECLYVEIGHTPSGTSNFLMEEMLVFPDLRSSCSHKYEGNTIQKSRSSQFDT